MRLKPAGEAMKTAGMEGVGALAALGFLVNFQPSEPYLTQYLLHSKNLSATELASDVFPWSTAGTFALLLPFALLAEVIGMRPVIFLGLLCREATRVVLLFASGVQWMACMQVTYAGGVAANTIYFAYVYSVVPAAAYSLATSLVLAAHHAGNVLGALAAQLLVSCAPAVAADLRPLFYLSWLFTTLGALAFWRLPPPSRAPPPAVARLLLRRGAAATAREAAAAYAATEARGWLLWWMLGLSAQTVVGNYFQLQMAQMSETVLYGLLEAALELALVAGALLAAPLAPLLARRPIAFVAVSSAGRAVAYAAAAAAAARRLEPIVWGMNVLGATLCALQQAAGSAAVASSFTTSNRYALVFSINTLLSNGVAALLGNIGPRFHFGTNDYYYAVAVNQLLLVCAAPLFAKAKGDDPSTSRAEEAEAAPLDRVMLPETEGY